MVNFFCQHMAFEPGCLLLQNPRGKPVMSRADFVDVGLAPAPRLPVTGSGDDLAVAAVWLLVFGLLAEVARRRLGEPYRRG